MLSACKITPSNSLVIQTISAPISPFTVDTTLGGLDSSDSRDPSISENLGGLDPRSILSSGSSGYSSLKVSPQSGNENLVCQVPKLLNDGSINQVRLQSKSTIDGFHVPARKVVKPGSYKTVMCKGWLETGQCSFGESCRFAHGEEERRPTKIPDDNPNYKTKFCNKYTKTGVCPYGDRCLFIHPKVPTVEGVKANPYINPKRLAQIVKNRNEAMANNLLDRNFDDMPVVNKRASQLHSWSAGTLSQERNRSYGSYSVKSSETSCDVEHYFGSEQTHSAGSVSGSECSSQPQKPQENLGFSEELKETRGFDIRTDESWASNISNIFDYAIATDNLARFLARDFKYVF